jgi:hypothetical protein
MKKQIILLIFFYILIASLFAQKEECKGVSTNDNGSPDPNNFIVLIDGRLPMNLFIEISWGEATDKQTLTYDYFLRYTNIMHNFSQNPSILDFLPDTTNIHVNIIFEEAIDYLKYKKQTYSFNISWYSFSRTRIISITNFNRKKNIYHVHFLLQPPLVTVLIWGKKYGNEKKFRKRVFEGLYPSQYEMPMEYPYRIRQRIPNRKYHHHRGWSYPHYY